MLPVDFEKRPFGINTQRRIARTLGVDRKTVGGIAITTASPLAIAIRYSQPSQVPASGEPLRPDLARGRHRALVLSPGTIEAVAGATGRAGRSLVLASGSVEVIAPAPVLSD